MLVTFLATPESPLMPKPKPQTVPAAKAVRQLSELLDGTEFRDESFVIIRNGKAAGMFIPCPPDVAAVLDKLEPRAT